MNECKIEIQEAKDFLFQIIGRFVTLIADNYEEDEKTNLFEKGVRMKFEEDIGLILSGISGKQLGGIEKLIGLTSMLKFAGDLKSVFDFIIYHPIVVANKKESTDLKEYFQNIFKTVRNNASILGYAEKPTISIAPSKKILPKPIDMMIGGDKKTENSGKKDDVDLSGLGGEDDDYDDDDDEGEEE